MSSTLFSRDYSFRGRHAEKVVELTAEFDKNKNKLFQRNIDVYLLAPIVGFLYGRRAEVDPTGRTTNILYATMSNETTNLWFNYRLILLLDEKHEPDFGMRVEKAFRHYGSDEAKADEDLYESYVRGGVDTLHDKLLAKANGPDDYLRNLYEFMEEFEGKYGQETGTILDLVKLARD